MRLTIVQESPIEQTSTLEVGDETSLDVLRGLIELDFNIKKENQLLLFHGQPLRDAPNKKDTSLKEFNIQDGEIIIVRNSSLGRVSVNPTNVTPNNGRSSSTAAHSATVNGQLQATLASLLLQTSTQIGSGSNRPPASLRGPALSVPKFEVPEAEVQRRCTELQSRANEDPLFIEHIEYTQPDLAEALRSKNSEMLAVSVRSMFEIEQKKRTDEHAQLLKAMLNPLDPESQKVLLGRAQQEQIDEALAHAQEYLPESFGNVFMLYINIELNGEKLQAFVDSGAQNTIMSLACAERCNLTRLIDRRFQGFAQGVGKGRIVGRIHVVQIKMGNQFFAASITVLEADNVDFLLGLDILRRHQCVIDLQHNVFRIGGEELQFLSEGEVSARSRPTPGTTLPSSPETVSHGATTIEPQRVSGRSGSSPSPPLSTLDVEKEGAIQRLIQLGMSRSKALSALERTAWNVDFAALLLFDTS